MTGVKARIEDRLTAAFAPERLEVTDDSALHAGHAGARPGGESHFSVTVVSAAFAGLNRVARHRAVNAALSEELAGPVHALAIQALAPDEAD